MPPSDASKVRLLDSVILEAVANKRPRNTAEVKDSMDVFYTSDTTTTNVRMNPDEILVEMVRCGDYSQDQVVDFCIQLNIPLSRMLRLDLMGTCSCNNRSNDYEVNYSKGYCEKGSGASGDSANETQR